MKNVSERLEQNGLFIFTVPDYKRILGLLLYSEERQSDDWILFWENKFCSIMIEKEELIKETLYGIGYGFYLAEGLIGNDV